MSSGESLSIIIVNFNGGLKIQCCLDSIRSSRPNAEVIVVDNNSTDGSPRQISRRYPWVNLIRNSRNLGFGSAVNSGVRASRGNFVFLLNPDTVLRDDTIERLLSGHCEISAKSGANVIIGPKVLNTDGTLQPSARAFPRYRNAFFNRTSLLTRLAPRNKFSRSYLKPHSGGDRIESVDWLSGAALFLSRATFERLGGFDEKFFMYCEDVDFCRRASLMGMQRVYYPAAELLHESGGCSSKGIPGLIVARHRSMWTYYKKHFSRNPAMDVAIFSGVVCRATYFLARHALLSSSSISSAIKAEVRGQIRNCVTLFRSRPYRFKTRPEKVLFLRTDHLGDVLLSLSAVSLFRNKYPEARISFLGRPAWKELVLATGLVDEYFSSFKSSRRKLAFLRARRFDLSIDLGQRNTLRDAFFCWLAGVGVRIGYHTSYTGVFHTRALRWDGRFRAESQMAARLLRLVGVSTSEFRRIPSDFRFRNSVESPVSGSYIVIHPFAVSSDGLKEWPRHRFVALANRLRLEGHRVVLVGTSQELEASREAFLELDPAITNLIGKTSLLELTRLLEGAKYVVANNSGVYQLAMVLGTPCLLLNGPSNLLRWGPVRNNVKVIQSDSLACMGRDCPTCIRGDHACMRSLSLDVVYRAIREQVPVMEEGPPREKHPSPSGDIQKLET